MSHSSRQRRKRIREGKPDTAGLRLQWHRKPQTQVVSNKKAENRRIYCRKGREDGGFDFSHYADFLQEGDSVAGKLTLLAG